MRRWESDDVVRTWAERGEREPLVVLEPLAAWLAEAGLVEMRAGGPELAAIPIGNGHSNVTFELRHGTRRIVLRRPPRGPLPPSAHDVLREARYLRALAPMGVRAPEVLAVCADEEVIGAPFYVMPFIEGHVVDRELPAELEGPATGWSMSQQMVDELVALHAVDTNVVGTSIGRPRDGYLRRQVDRFAELLRATAVRPLGVLEWVGDWLADTMPESPGMTVVHGDYRLGNAVFAPCGAATPRLRSILDWEMVSVGDPLADLGYLTATWSEPGDRANPMFDLSAVTRLPGFDTRAQLTRRYAESSGRSVQTVGWYQVLALWKAAIFLEGSYARYVAGSTDDAFFAQLGDGVPALAEEARRRARAYARTTT